MLNYINADLFCLLVNRLSDAQLRVCIIHGGSSGGSGSLHGVSFEQANHTKHFLEETAQAECSHNLSVVVVPAASLDALENLLEFDLILWFVSTSTGGAPPKDSERIFEILKTQSREYRNATSRTAASILYKTFFAVVGFGSVSYGEGLYCRAAKECDKLLHQLGAMRLTQLFCVTDTEEVPEQMKLWESRLAKGLRWHREHSAEALQGREAREGTKQTPAGVAHEDNKTLPPTDADGYSCDDTDSEDESDGGEGMGSDTGSENDETNVSVEEGPAGSSSAKKMLTDRHKKNLTKSGYRLVGSHSAVKLCRWTKHHIRGRGGCYKHSFYGISSMQCMEATPSLACANKCVFCWRHHKNPVGTSWQWQTDDAEMIVRESLQKHLAMIAELKGVPDVTEDRLKLAMQPKHCALSLVGEPVMYPQINSLIEELHKRNISSFLVTNAQFPDPLRELTTCTQLYLSLDASSPTSLKEIDRPLFSDYWERLLECLDILRCRKERTVLRLTLVKGYNMEDEELKNYAELIGRAKPDFVEVKAVTFAGAASGSVVTMNNIPWQEEVIQFSKSVLQSRYGLAEDYEIACEHRHSCSVLLASTRFKIEGEWHTWIDYPKFFELACALREGRVPRVDALDYAAKTPSWAVWGAEERGFDPEEVRKYTKGKALRQGKSAAAGGDVEQK